MDNQIIPTTTSLSTYEQANSTSSSSSTFPSNNSAAAINMFMQQSQQIVIIENNRGGGGKKKVYSRGGGGGGGPKRKDNVTSGVQRKQLPSSQDKKEVGGDDDEMRRSANPYYGKRSCWKGQGQLPKQKQQQWSHYPFISDTITSGAAGSIVSTTAEKKKQINRELNRKKRLEQKSSADKLRGLVPGLCSDDGMAARRKPGEGTVMKKSAEYIEQLHELLLKQKLQQQQQQQQALLPPPPPPPQSTTVIVHPSTAAALRPLKSTLLAQPHQVTQNNIPCKFGSACSFKQTCKYTHPIVFCKFDALCKNTSCPYQHTKKPIVAATTATGQICCKYFPNCKNKDACPFYHPPCCKYPAGVCRKVDCKLYHNNNNNEVRKETTIATGKRMNLLFFPKK